MVRNSNMKILAMLMKNSRIPFVKIAKALGISETAVRKRVSKMEREGIIKRYTIEVDAKKIGFEVVALIGIDTKPESYMDVLDKMKKMQYVRSLHASSGDHMLIAECWFENSAKLRNFVKKLKRLRGVTRVCPAILLEKIK